MKDSSKSRSGISRKGAVILFVLGTALSAALMFVGEAVEASRVARFQETDSIKIGERLTYSVSLDGFGNVGHADLSVVNRSRFEGRDAFEVRLKMKTFDVVNAAFFPIDEVRTAYLDAASGLPFVMKRVVDPSGFPRETVSGFPGAPSGLDISALIYKVRRAGGQGKFRLVDGDDKFWVEMKSRDGGRIETDAGAFDTTMSEVRSRYFKSIGISDVKINLSTDDAHVPVLISFKTEYGAMVARLTGMTSAKASDSAAVAVTPKPAPFPVANPVRPKPTPVKTPYLNDRPLGTDLPFMLREKLTYWVKNGEAQIGKVTVEARERRMVDGKDSLLLLMNVAEAAPNATLFTKDDYFKAQVDPSSILPFSSEVRFRGSLSPLNFTAKFDQETGTATVSGSPLMMPSNTHTLLSLFFALRTFNLRPSKTVGNPINDTRVSVVWNGKPTVFTVRPIDSQILTVNGSKIQTQQVGIITGDPQIDALNIRVWISVDDVRRAFKITAGTYSAELVTSEFR